MFTFTPSAVRFFGRRGRHKVLRLPTEVTLQQVDSDDRSDDSILVKRFVGLVVWCFVVVFVVVFAFVVVVVVVVLVVVVVVLILLLLLLFLLHLCEVINVFSDHIHMASCVLAQKGWYCRMIKFLGNESS